MVLTRAQRAQTTTEPEAPKAARAAKTNTTIATSKPSRAAPKSRKAAEIAAALEEEESNPVKKTSRATSITASSAAKTKASKSALKEEEKPKPKAVGRPRKQVQFAEEPETKTQAVEEPVLPSSARSRPRKAAVPPAPAKSLAATNKAAVPKTDVVRSTVSKAVNTKAPAATRGRPRKAVIAAEAALPVKDAAKELKSSSIGKPIRPKKAAAALQATIVPQNDQPEMQSTLQGPDPKMAPPIRASPVKAAGPSASMQPLAFPALQNSLASPSKSMGSPVRLGARLNLFAGESPLRATPVRPLVSGLSQVTNRNNITQPVFSNPLLQSPVRPSAKKPVVQCAVAKPTETPLRSIGTPIRRKLRAGPMALPFPQTVGPQKRSFMESPRRPQSAQASKRMKILTTPESSDKEESTTPSSIKTFTRIGSAKKTVSFRNSSTEDGEQQESVVAQSSSYQFHRMSAVTEITEPEESVNEIFAINPTMDAMDGPENVEEAIEIGEDEMDVDVDISMSEMVGADFTLGEVFVPERITADEPSVLTSVEVIGKVEPLGKTAPFEDVKVIHPLEQEFMQDAPVDEPVIEILGEIEAIGDAEPFEDIESKDDTDAQQHDVEMSDEALEMDVTQLVEEFQAESTEVILTTEHAESSSSEDKEVTVVEETTRTYPAQDTEVAINTESNQILVATENVVATEFEQALVEAEVVVEVPVNLKMLEDALLMMDAGEDASTVGEEQEEHQVADEETVAQFETDLIDQEPLMDMFGLASSAQDDFLILDNNVENEVNENTAPSVAPDVVKEPLAFLNGMTFFLDVWGADGNNANQAFAPLLQELGAEIAAEFTSDVTHVLFKEGSKDTLKKVVDSDGSLYCLNVGWAVDCERLAQRLPEDGYLVDPYVDGGLAPRTPLRELPTNSRGATPMTRSRKTPGKTPRKTPGKTPRKATGKTPGTVKFNKALMEIHDAIQTPEIIVDPAMDVENMDSPATQGTPLMQKTCPPKQSNQPFFANDVTTSAVKRRLFRSRKSLGDALMR